VHSVVMHSLECVASVSANCTGLVKNTTQKNTHMTVVSAFVSKAPTNKVLKFTTRRY
jgi:hypothetical protein